MKQMAGCPAATLRQTSVDQSNSDVATHKKAAVSVLSPDSCMRGRLRLLAAERIRNARFPRYRAPQRVPTVKHFIDAN